MEVKHYKFEQALAKVLGLMVSYPQEHSYYLSIANLALKSGHPIWSIQIDLYQPMADISQDTPFFVDVNTLDETLSIPESSIVDLRDVLQAIDIANKFMTTQNQFVHGRLTVLRALEMNMWEIWYACYDSENVCTFFKIEINIKSGDVEVLDY